MHFNYSAKTKDLQIKLQTFMEAHIYPNERIYHAEINSGDRWQPLQLIEDLKSKAKAEGLWNLFLPEVSTSFSMRGIGVSNPVKSERLCSE
jgi:acyl-CoA dehydrogenase